MNYKVKMIFKKKKNSIYKSVKKIEKSTKNYRNNHLQRKACDSL